MIKEQGRLSYAPFYLELMFSYALNSDWAECAKYAQLLQETNHHSPAITTYASAVFKYVLSEHKADPDLKKEAIELLE